MSGGVADGPIGHPPWTPLHIRHIARGLNLDHTSGSATRLAGWLLLHSSCGCKAQPTRRGSLLRRFGRSSEQPWKRFRQRIDIAFQSVVSAALAQLSQRGLPPAAGLALPIAPGQGSHQGLRAARLAIAGVTQTLGLCRRVEAEPAATVGQQGRLRSASSRSGSTQSGPSSAMTRSPSSLPIRASALASAKQMMRSIRPRPGPRAPSLHLRRRGIRLWSGPSARRRPADDR
jgi:hypothetical protein